MATGAGSESFEEGVVDFEDSIAKGKWREVHRLKEVF
jgi:hypothetical protein